MTEPIVEAERLEELRDVLSRIPGSDRKPWTLEIYDLHDGVEVLTRTLDIRTGRSVSKRGGGAGGGGRRLPRGGVRGPEGEHIRGLRPRQA